MKEPLTEREKALVAELRKDTTDREIAFAISVSRRLQTDARVLAEEYVHCRNEIEAIPRGS